MKVTVRYFAQLADLADKSTEEWTIDHSSPEKLYQRLKDQYGFTLDFRKIQVAINDQLSGHNTSLSDGDSVAFLPPMTGG